MLLQFLAGPLNFILLQNKVFCSNCCCRSSYYVSLSRRCWNDRFLFPCLGFDRHAHLVNLPDGRSRCDICNKLFATRSSATCHYIRFHEVSESYECCLCKRIFPNKMNFRSHIILKHNVRGRDVVKFYAKVVPSQ